MDKTTYEYLKPSKDQLDTMTKIRSAAAEYSSVLESEIPEGPDKTYLLRKLREVAMWANIAVTRHTDGAPR